MAMFTVGERLKGWVLNDEGEEILVFGAYEATTDDPEEIIQDVIIRDDNGKVHYIDEQTVRRA